MSGNAEHHRPPAIYLTQAGLPLSIRLDWPFHKATSGSDFWVLHATLTLESSPGLHARVAVNLSATVREILPSLEPAVAEAPVLAALRKEVDRKQVEFLKSAKLVPLQFSSRHYDFRKGQWRFGTVPADVARALVLRKVFWQTRAGTLRVWIADPADALYLETTPGTLVSLAADLARQGLVSVEGEFASATPQLMSSSEKFERESGAALHELELKHEFERG